MLALAHQRRAGSSLLDLARRVWNARLCAQVAVIAPSTEWGNGVTFFLALLSLCPFAERIAFVTEDLAKSVALALELSLVYDLTPQDSAFF